MHSPATAEIPSITLRPPSPTVSTATITLPAELRPRATVAPQSPTVLRSSLRRPTVTRSASVTIVEDEQIRVKTSTSKSGERAVLDQLRSLLDTSSDATVLVRVRSLIGLEQEYCRQLVVTHEKQKALDRALADARKATAQQRLQARIESKDREMDCLHRRATRLDSFNRDILARVAIRTAAHSDAEKRILRARIEQQNRQIRDLEGQLRDARTTTTRRGQSLCNR
ncbi:hypothetical protein PENTCL1PPCAC_8309, partial [Pristionchus entomophagus]